MKKTTFLILFLLGAFISSAQTFPGNNPGLAIGDNSCDPLTNEDTATVAGVGILGPGGSSIEVQEVVINITHTWSGDLDITLIAPDGVTTLELTTDNGGSGDNYTDTRFQSGGADITADAAPFTGIFAPEGGDFTVFNGVDGDGDWTLQVCDDAGQDTGTLDSWEITFAMVLSSEDIQTEGFTYYPNPVRNDLNLISPLPMSNASVFDISGKQVLRETLNEKQSALNLSGLSPGVYFVKVMIDDKQNTFKVIKE